MAAFFAAGLELVGREMIAASFTDTVEGKWLKLQPLRVGRIPASLGAPERHVIVTDEGLPLLRVEVYAYGPDCFAFEAVVAWRSNVIIGFGSHVHAVSLAQRDVITVPLGSYFGHLYPTLNYLLVASGERLFRMEPDRSIRWQSDVLAVDGVVVESPGPEIIHGRGESDPPGGWKPFALCAANGLPALSRDVTTIQKSQDLVDALSASDVMVRVAAIGDIVRKPEAARPKLAAILADLALPPRPRVWAMIAICQIGHGDAAEILRGLVESLTDASPIVRRSAVETLGILRVHSAVPQIAKCLTDHASIPEAWFDDDATPAQPARRALALIASPEAEAVLATTLDA